VAGGSIAVYYCNRVIGKATAGKLYNDTQAIPFNKVGLLLGTGKFLQNGTVNPYYLYRIQAATALYKAGKIKYIVVSGDNSRNNYNEPALMRTDLIQQGIDSTHIYADYAGFRTFDSVVRLKEIFGQSSATIISQPFHNERAVYIASREGMATIGFNARDVDVRSGLRTQIREKLARTKVFVDYLTGKQPRFLGEKILIP
jgi:SanA protein